MEKEAIVSKLTVIFRNVFTSSDLILNDELNKMKNVGDLIEIIQTKLM